MNKEFLKGIKSREQAVILKQIIKQDSLIIKSYKDSIVPGLEFEIVMTEQALDETYSELDQTTVKMKNYRGAFFGTLALLIISIIF